MSEDRVEYHREGKLAFIKLDRPEVLNAIDAPMEAALHAAFERFDLDEDAWVAILHGEGKHFCVGADVKQRFHEASESDRDIRMALDQRPEGWLGRFVNWKPIISAVQGYCLGGGLGLALESDLVVASDDAVFGVAETVRGVAAGPLWARLQTFMPSKVATELLLTGDHMPASELYRLGVVNRLVTRDQLLETAQQLAHKATRAAPLAVRANVRLTRLPAVKLAAEAHLYTSGLRLHRTEDFRESSRAFMEKRSPSFKAR
jgi:enoyl-CoA hydratase/carnithine racemase